MASPASGRNAGREGRAQVLPRIRPDVEPVLARARERVAGDERRDARSRGFEPFAQRARQAPVRTEDHPRARDVERRVGREGRSRGSRARTASSGDRQAGPIRRRANGASAGTDRWAATATGAVRRPRRRPSRPPLPRTRGRRARRGRSLPRRRRTPKARGPERRGPPDRDGGSGRSTPNRDRSRRRPGRRARADARPRPRSEPDAGCGRPSSADRSPGRDSAEVRWRSRSPGCGAAWSATPASTRANPGSAGSIIREWNACDVVDALRPDALTFQRLAEPRDGLDRTRHHRDRRGVDGGDLEGWRKPGREGAFRQEDRSHRIPRSHSCIRRARAATSVKPSASEKTPARQAATSLAQRMSQHGRGPHAPGHRGGARSRTRPRTAPVARRRCGAGSRQRPRRRVPRRIPAAHARSTPSSGASASAHSSTRSRNSASRA